VWCVLGAGYHTIHHTTYKHNYGAPLSWEIEGSRDMEGRQRALDSSTHISLAAFNPSPSIYPSTHLNPITSPNPPPQQAST